MPQEDLEILDFEDENTKYISSTFNEGTHNYRLLPFADDEEEASVFKILRKHSSETCADLCAEKSKTIDGLPEKDRLAAILSHFCIRFVFWDNDIITSAKQRSAIGDPIKLATLIVSRIRKSPGVLAYFGIPARIFPEEGDEAWLAETIVSCIKYCNERPDFLQNEAAISKYSNLKELKRRGVRMPSAETVVQHLKWTIIKYYLTEEEVVNRQDISKEESAEEDEARLRVSVLERRVWEAQCKSKS